MSKSSTLYKDFQGHEAQGKIKIPFTNPRELIYLARPVSIVYESDKLNGGGDGEPALYEHKFHKSDILATDPTGKQLFILGPNLKIDDRGIVN